MPGRTGPASPHPTRLTTSRELVPPPSLRPRRSRRIASAQRSSAQRTRGPGRTSDTTAVLLDFAARPTSLSQATFDNELDTKFGTPYGATAVEGKPGVCGRACGSTETRADSLSTGRSSPGHRLITNLTRSRVCGSSHLSMCSRSYLHHQPQQEPKRRRPEPSGSGLWRLSGRTLGGSSPPTTEAHLTRPRRRLGKICPDHETTTKCLVRVSSAVNYPSVRSASTPGPAAAPRWSPAPLGSRAGHRFAGESLPERCASPSP